MVVPTWVHLSSLFLNSYLLLTYTLYFVHCQHLLEFVCLQFPQACLIAQNGVALTRGQYLFQVGHVPYIRLLVHHLQNVNNRRHNDILKPQRLFYFLAYLHSLYKASLSLSRYLDR